MAQNVCPISQMFYTSKNSKKNILKNSKLAKKSSRANRAVGLLCLALWTEHILVGLVSCSDGKEPEEFWELVGLQLAKLLCFNITFVFGGLKLISLYCKLTPMVEDRNKLGALHQETHILPGLLLLHVTMVAPNVWKFRQMIRITLVYYIAS